MKKRPNKKWRLNVIVDYDNQVYATRNRVVIFDLLRGLAKLYRLDYAISEDHKFPSFEQSSLVQGVVVDIFYFRSHESSKIDKKEFRSLINLLFSVAPSSFSEGANVGTQLAAVLNVYPFPSDFYRPLNYPYIEVHKGFQRSLHIYAAVLEEVIEKEQDFRQN